MNFVIYFLLTCGLSIWQGSFSFKVACFGNIVVLQGFLIGCNMVFKCGKDLLMFQNPLFSFSTAEANNCCSKDSYLLLP
jgi:hypothetical protein